MNVSREQLLELIKSSITTLQTKNKELVSDDKFRNAWQRESKLITERVSQLSPEDLKWLNDAYQQWSIVNLKHDLNSFMDNYNKNKA